jgi:DNA-binding transcriptional MerR regulator
LFECPCVGWREHPAGRIIERVSAEQPVEPRYAVAAVARRLGVAPATLRTWDRRYGLGPSEHAAGSHRRYTESDLDRLRAMRRLLLDGVPPAEAARIALSGAEPAATRRGPGGPGGRVLAVRGATPDVRGLARAAFALDAPEISRAVRRCVADLGVIRAWDELVRPVLAAIGEHWEATQTGVDVEHLVSECTIGVLHGVVADTEPQGRPVLLACAEGEGHSLPLHALRAALAERGVPVRLLGAATPSDALVAAVRRVGPAAVVVWSQLERTGRPEQLAAIPVTRPPTRVLAGGPGWPQDQLPARASYVKSMPEAVDILSTTVHG